MADIQRIAITHSDGYAAHARYWPALAPARGAVLYLHGIQSHGGWFEPSAAALATAGFHVLLPDRRGSGCNRQDRGHACSAGRLLKDVAEAGDWLKRATAVSTFALVGISWGGKLALAAAMHSPESIYKVVLVAPGLFPQVDLTGREKLAVALNALIRPRRPFPVPLNEPELFTDNPDKQAFIRDDPLRLRTATARFLAASRMLDIRIRRAATRHQWPFAVTIILAGRERIIDNEQTKRFARTLRCRSRRIVEHTNAAHTLEFEPDPSDYLADLVTAVASRQ